VPEPEFRPEALLAALDERDVRFVLVGGFAAVIHGSPYVTTDLDVVPDAGTANVARLSDALRDVHARVWTSADPGGLAFEHDAASLARSNTWNLITDHGRLDVVLRPSGTSGYQDLARDAVRLEILGARVDVASLADVVRSKEAAGRDKDRVVLPVLRRILDEQRIEDGS
jgi:hypothetical protein